MLVTNCSVRGGGGLELRELINKSIKQGFPHGIREQPAPDTSPSMRQSEGEAGDEISVPPSVTAHEVE